MWAKPSAENPILIYDTTPNHIGIHAGPVTLAPPLRIQSRTMVG